MDESKLIEILSKQEIPIDLDWNDIEKLDIIYNDMMNKLYTSIHNYFTREESIYKNKHIDVDGYYHDEQYLHVYNDDIIKYITQIICLFTNIEDYNIFLNNPFNETHEDKYSFDKHACDWIVYNPLEHYLDQFLEIDVETYCIKFHFKQCDFEVKVWNDLKVDWFKKTKCHEYNYE